MINIVVCKTEKDQSTTCKLGKEHFIIFSAILAVSALIFY